MKILILSQNWWPENGVPQRRWTWLADILGDAGNEIIVVAPFPHSGATRPVRFVRWLCCGRDSDEVGPSGETIVRCSYFSASHSLKFKAIDQVVVGIGMMLATLRYRRRWRDVDLVIGTVPALPIAVVARWAARLLKVPYAIDLRDPWPDLFKYSQQWDRESATSKQRGGRCKRFLAKLLGEVVSRLLWEAYGRSDAMIFTTGSLARRISRELANRSTPAPTPFVVRNVFPPQIEGYRKELRRVDRSSLNVLYAGTIGRAQHLSNAIEAVDRVNKRGYQVNLRLVGDGASVDVLKRIVDTRKVPVEFGAKVTGKAILDHYEWADTALVHLTDWEPLSTAIPSKAFELIQAGIHISAVVSGEAARLVADLGAGHVVPPEDPDELATLWASLLEDPSMLDVGPLPSKKVAAEALAVRSELHRFTDFFEDSRD